MFYLDGCLQLHATFLERYRSAGKKKKKKVKNKNKSRFWKHELPGKVEWLGYVSSKNQKIEGGRHKSLPAHKNVITCLLIGTMFMTMSLLSTDMSDILFICFLLFSFIFIIHHSVLFVCFRKMKVTWPEKFICNFKILTFLAVLQGQDHKTFNVVKKMSNFLKHRRHSEVVKQTVCTYKLPKFLTLYKIKSFFISL